MDLELRNKFIINEAHNFVKYHDIKYEYWCRLFPRYRIIDRYESLVNIKKVYHICG